MQWLIKTPTTDQEWQQYYELRWRILRAPWQQPRGSERDDVEAEAFHLMAVAPHDPNAVIGVARLQQLDATTAQIRYMAVADSARGYGIGSALLQQLENKARDWQCTEIRLNSREHAIGFYQRYAYEIIGQAPTLFGTIKHVQMSKSLCYR